MTDEDRKQIGLTEAGQEAVELLTKELGWFNEGQDAGRFALAFAVRSGVTPGRIETVDTRWSPDGFDPDGDIRRLLQIAYPENTTPVRLMERLIDQGLRLIAEGIDSGDDEPLSYI